MAFTIYQYPVSSTATWPVATNWTPAIGYMILRNDDVSALYYYNIIMKVYLTSTSGTLLAYLKSRRNGYFSDITNNYARAFFDLRGIVNSQLTDTVYDQLNTWRYKSIHSIGANFTTKMFSKNGDIFTGKTQIATIAIQSFQFYSSAEGTAPTADTSTTLTDTQLYMEASFPLDEPLDSLTTRIQSSAFITYTMTDTDSKFLSDVGTGFKNEYGLTTNVNYVREDDYHTLAFLNDNSNFNSDCRWIHVTYYDASGNIIQTGGGGDWAYFQNSSANGGCPPQDADEDDERLIYVGVGPKNLEKQAITTSFRPSAFTNWAYYKVQAANNVTVGGSDPLTSEPYYFIKQDSNNCKGYEIRRLAWINTKGGYDYFNFNKKSQKTIEIERDEYSKMLGRFDISFYFYNVVEGGKSTRKVKAILKETINTDWISEGDANLIENCILSKRVHVINDLEATSANLSVTTHAVVVTNSSFIKKTVANDKLIQYTLEIEYANPYNTNS